MPIINSTSHHNATLKTLQSNPISFTQRLPHFYELQEYILFQIKALFTTLHPGSLFVSSLSVRRQNSLEYCQQLALHGKLCTKRRHLEKMLAELHSCGENVHRGLQVRAGRRHCAGDNISSKFWYYLEIF